MTEQFQEPSANAADQAASVQPTQEITEPSVITAGGREFKSTDDLDKHITHAQTHISKIEEENRALREQLQKQESQSKSVEDILAKIESNTPSEEPTVQYQAQGQREEVDIDSLLEQKLNERKAKELQNNNYSQCMSEAKKLFGDEYLEKLNSMSAELGIDNGVDLAKNSPQAFKKLFLSSKQSQPSAGTTSDLNFLAKYSKPKEAPSARYNVFAATSKDVANAWAAAGEKVKAQRNN